ncbi:uncharacterized protein LOC141532255 [Cotesia typhae]|uniref:uncharacterized protein LOC141532255 n=1 Tax=Cotesia typhae TaxID=2053667 RepID=UPI003D68B98D
MWNSETSDVKIDVLVDFNGYLNSDDDFVLRECFITSLQSNAPEKLFVFKDKKDLAHMSYVQRLRIKEYVKKYGIDLKAGWYQVKKQKALLKKHAKCFKTIWVRDEDKRDVFRSVVGKKVDIKWLSDLGYDGGTRVEDERCGYHGKSEDTECAREEAVKMKSWLIPKLETIKLKVDDDNDVLKNLDKFNQNLTDLPYM